MSLYGALGLTFVITGFCAAIAEIIKNRRIVMNWFANKNGLHAGFARTEEIAKNGHTKISPPAIPIPNIPGTVQIANCWVNSGTT